MPTYKQTQAAQKMVENGGNVSKAMKDAGYSDATANTPKKLTESKGFLELLDDYGLTEELIIKSLVEDIKSNAGKRRIELTLAAKLRGMFKRETTLSADLPQPILISWVSPDDEV